MGYGLFGPRPGFPPSGGGGGAGNCVDYAINSAAELEAAFPAAAGVHTLNADGSFCWGRFALTGGNRIAIPANQRQLHMGHGPDSLVSGLVDNALFTVDANAQTTFRDFAMVNTSTNAASACLNSASFDCKLSCMTMGATVLGVIHSGGVMLSQNLFIDGFNAATVGGTGITLNGNLSESHWTNTRMQNCNSAGRTTGPYSSAVFVGGRVNNCGDGFRLEHGANSIGDLSVQAMEFQALDDAVQWVSGSVNRANVIGNTAAADVTTLVDWQAANIPTDCLLVCGNVTSINAGSFIQNHAFNSPRANYKCNSRAGGLFSETPIVP